VRSHHEKWDGTGYPDRLAGLDIPLAARVFAVADVLDALTTDRPYRPACSLRYARSMITSDSGKHFDPQVIDAFDTIDDHVFERIAAEIR
jgi:HD-GYP domain-containing protein (c-di-GMP phosphodiesterase class II)